MPVVAALVAAAETVVADATPLRGTSPEEIALLARWLDSGGVRIVSATDGYCEPAAGTGRWIDWYSAVNQISRRERH